MNAMTKVSAGQVELRRDRLLRLPAVLEMVPLSRATIYRRAASGTFPRPVPLGENSSGWYESEVLRWINDRASHRA